MHRPVAWTAAVVLTLLAACGPGDEAPRPPAEPPATPLAFTAHGLPGPWWQLGGSPRDFQRDSRNCRVQSSRARERATADRLDAAYRAFLDCMQARRWQHGLPPERPAGEAASRA